MVSATIAKKKTNPLFTLTFDYGQRAVKMEILAAKKICRALRIKHKVVQISFFDEFKKLVMLSKRRTIAIKNFKRLKDVWVPNRNGLFINIAACYAEYYGADLIITGFNLEEAREFPDNTPEFISAANLALAYSTLNKVKVRSYVAGLTKKEIYKAGLYHKAPLNYIYSCYLGSKRMCGKCASCLRLKRVLQYNDTRACLSHKTVRNP